MMKPKFSLADCPLGKKLPYPQAYDPGLLFAIPRQWSREKTFSAELEAGLSLGCFSGADIWHDYEFSYRDKASNQRILCFLQIVIPSTSEYLIESKSFKLYLFSFAQEQLSADEVLARIETDTSRLTGSSVRAELLPLSAPAFQPQSRLATFVGLDNLAPCSTYDLDPSLLARAVDSQPHSSITQAYRFANFRSLCLISGKPDWAEIHINLTGPAIDPIALYRYLVSFRNHQGIHEQCIERIYFDLKQLLNPTSLVVAGFFTRRGNLDINPIRTLVPIQIDTIPELWHRTERQ